MKTYKYIIFDLDGTLVDTDLLVIEGVRNTLEHFNYHATITLRDLVSFLGPTLRDSFSKFLEQSVVEEAIKYYIEFSKREISKLATLYDDVIDILDNLKEKGFKLAIVTSKMRSNTEVTLKTFNLDMFDVVISLEDVGTPKPAPDGIIKAIEMLNGDKAETLYIGDNESDGIAAYNANVDFGLVTWSVKNVDIKADYYIDSYRKLYEVLTSG